MFSIFAVTFEILVVAFFGLERLILVHFLYFSGKTKYRHNLSFYETSMLYSVSFAPKMFLVRSYTKRFGQMYQVKKKGS